MARQSHFYLIHLTHFRAISMRMMNMSGVFIQILITRTMDPVTGSNLKRWHREAIFFGHKWRKQQHKCKPSKVGSPNYRPKITSCCRAESQKHAAWRKIWEELNSRVDLVTHISISNVFVPSCWSNATTANIWNTRNFCIFFLLAKNRKSVNPL